MVLWGLVGKVYEIKGNKKEALSDWKIAKKLAVYLDDFRLQSDLLKDMYPELTNK